MPQKCRFIDLPIIPFDGQLEFVDTKYISHNGGNLKTALNGFDERVQAVENSAIKANETVSRTDTITIPYTDAGLYMLCICATDNDNTKYPASAYLLRIDGDAWITLISSPAAEKSIKSYMIDEENITLTMCSESNYLATIVKM